MDEIYALTLVLLTLSYFTLLFIYAPTDQMDQLICTLNGSNAADWAKNEPFENGVDTQLHFRVENAS
jgi:hypothetical protein